MDRADLLDRALDLVARDCSPRLIALVLDHRECAMLSLAQSVRGLAVPAPPDGALARLAAKLGAQVAGPHGP
jgi:hypothetical protein